MDLMLWRISNIDIVEVGNCLLRGCLSDWEDEEFEKLYKYAEYVNRSTEIIQQRIDDINYKIKQLEAYSDSNLDERLERLLEQI